MIKKVFLSLLFPIILIKALYGEEIGTVRTEEIIIVFEEPLRTPAIEITKMYPGIKDELEKHIGWKFNFKPKVLLVKNHERFQRMARGRPIVAYALPHKGLTVIDYSIINTHPYTLMPILQHELCHLLLHHHIEDGNLPKWLDEGISQWVSDGIAEIIMERKPSILNEAILSGNLMKIDDLQKNFPNEMRSLLLAYEQSKSFVEYMNREFGRNKVIEVLKYLKDGYKIDMAISKSFSIPLDELERRWNKHIRMKTTWVTYLITNIYEILFFIAALIAIYGFFKLMIKKRMYNDKEDVYLPNS